MTSLQSWSRMEAKESMYDTKSDSDDSIIFVGVSKTVKVNAEIDNVAPSPVLVPNTPSKQQSKKRRILQTGPDEPSFIPDTQGKMLFMKHILLKYLIYKVDIICTIYP